MYRAIMNNVKAIKCTEARMKTDFSNPDILSRRETADLLGICRNTLDRSDIPRIKIGKRVVYKRDVLNKWLDDQTEKGKKGKKHE